MLFSLAESFTDDGNVGEAYAAYLDAALEALARAKSLESAVSSFALRRCQAKRNEIVSAVSSVCSPSTSSWCEQTRAELGPTLQRRMKLNDKYIQRPPFRFLHDIATAFIEVNHFGLHIFSESDRSVAQVSISKESKMDFLRKWRFAVQFTLNKTTTVRPKSIVTGQDVETTGEFLRLFSECAWLPLQERIQGVRYFVL